MGFAQLYLVQPREPQFRIAPQALALAAGARDVLEQALVFDSLTEALKGVQLAMATSGYGRQFGPQPLEIRHAAQFAAEVVHREGAHVAFVFGPERTGLSNLDVQRCHLCCSIPSDPQRGSLNLAQAVQVVAYESRRELLAYVQQTDQPLPRRGSFNAQSSPQEPAASIEQTEAMFAHLEQGLVAIGYLDPNQPKHLLARLRQLLLRARPTSTEVDVLRGIASAMVLPRRLRAGSKSASPSGRASDSAPQEAPD